MAAMDGRERTDDIVRAFPGTSKLDRKRVRLPIIGWVRLSEELRYLVALGRVVPESWPGERKPLALVLTASVKRAAQNQESGMSHCAWIEQRMILVGLWRTS